MALILRIVLMLALAVIAFLLLRWAFRGLAWRFAGVARWMAMITIAGLAALALGMAAGFAADWALGLDSATAGVLVAMLAMPVLLIWQVKQRSRIKAALTATIELAPVAPLEPAQPRPDEAESPLKREADKAVRAAWERANVLAPDHLRQLARARQACAQLLRLHEADGLDPALIEHAVQVKRHVAATVAAVDALWEDAGTDERSALAEALGADLARIGERAAAQVSRHRQALHDARAVLRAHVANLVANDPD